MVSNKIKISVLILFLLIGQSGLFAQIKSAKKDSTKKVTFAGIPVINYNKSLGFIVGAMGSMYYKLNRHDLISPSSSTMLYGMYTGNKTYMVMVAQKFYFSEDKWRGKIVAGTGDYYFQTFQNLPGSSSGRYWEDGVWIDFDTDARFFVAEIQRRVIPNLYLGFEAVFTHAETTFKIPNTELEPKQTADMNSLGYTIQYDNRSNVNFPVKGFFVNFKNRFVRDAFGATEDFDRYEISANNFWDIKKNNKSILVSRIFAKIATGDVPFQGQNVIGGDDLRGYSKGEYRGNQVYAIQAELRQNIYKKFGMVGFLGVGSAVDKLGNISGSDVLPSIGVGVRYLMIAKEKINIGLDVGVGKNDWSLTFRIGEAFSR